MWFSLHSRCTTYSDELLRGQRQQAAELVPHLYRLPDLGLLEIQFRDHIYDRINALGSTLAWSFPF